MYREQKNSRDEITSVLRSDGWSIPFDPANTDYQEYLKWVAEGNEPLPHDAPVLEQASENTFTVQI